MQQTKGVRYFFRVIILIVIATTGCRQIAVHEKMTNIPGHEWKRNHNAIVEIDVKDSMNYNLFFLIRHSKKFRFTNIIATLTIRDTAKKTKPLAFMKLNIPLVNEKGNWAGDNLDDLYFHKVRISQPVFLKPGRYEFILQQEMKENPLKYVMNAGVGIEKTSTKP